MRTCPVALTVLASLAAGLAAGGPRTAPSPDSPPAVGQPSDTVRVAALDRWPPYYHWPADGRPTGFAVETFRDVAERAGLVPRFRRFSSFPAAIGALREGQIDVIPNLGDVPSRRAWTSFTGPVQTFPVVLFTRQDGPAPRDLAEAAGLTVGVVRENVGAELLADGPSVEREVYPGAEAALFGLLAGEVDAVVYPRPVLLALARSIGVVGEIRASETSLREVKRAIAVRPDRPALRARLDAAVAGYVGSEVYERRYRRWFGRAEPFWTVERVAWTAGGALLLVVALLAGWRHRAVRRLNRRLRESEERHERILTEISDVVTLLDADGTIQYQSPAIERVFGYEEDELIGTPAFELAHPDDALELTEAFFAAVEGRGTSERTVRYRFRHADGSWRMVESIGVVPEDEGLGPVIMTRDITDRVQAQEKYRAIFSTTPSAVGLATLEEGKFVEVNPAFRRLLGYSREEAVGATVDELDIWVRPEQRELILARLREEGVVRNVEAQFRTADGDLLQVLFSGSVLELGDARYLVGVAQDITERKEFEEALERQALHDPLTGLPNRTLLTDRLEQAVARSRRDGEPLGLLMLDVDQFKRINDRLGHSVGDRVLVELARRLQETVRGQDTVARWGGDEFFVVLPGLDEPGQITAASERLREAVRGPFETGGESVHLEITIGGVVYSDADSRHAVQTRDPEELIRFGSLALHWAREEGPASFKLFDPDVEVEGATLIRQERELRDAIVAGDIVPHYQPVVRLEDGAPLGVEALARWRHPERGLLRPSDFILLAEELGLIGKLGETIVRQGCRQVAGWEAEGATEGSVAIAFNVSGQQFGDPELAPKLREWVVDGGLRPEQVTLEVTETSLMQVPARIDALRKMGFHIFVDDFGTGYSTFTYLRNLEVDGLKIDLTFVQHLMESSSDAALVETMLTLAERLGLRAVAEGIETESQRRKLQTLGCELGQGYLFARPMAGEEAAEWWRERSGAGA